MVRAWRLTLVVAVLGVVTVLAFPGNGSAFRGVSILLTPGGPSPSVLTMGVGLYPLWINSDTVTHSVVFANGLCSFQVTPGAIGQCDDAFVGQLGNYPYAVDGKDQASLVVVAEGREVTLSANTHTVIHGSRLKLHGEVHVPNLSPPVRPAPQRVIVLARPDRYHPFHRVRVVTAITHGWDLQWQLRVRPRARTIYIVEANSDTDFWQRAWSNSFRVAVRRR